MINKEIRDTVKLFWGSIGVALVTLGFSFLLIRLLVDNRFPFSEAAPITAYILLMIMAFYLGISLFTREKNERTFEYLFSLKYSRRKILLFKLAPRLAALLAYLLIYFLLSRVIDSFPVPAGWPYTLLLFFSLFLSAASLSLLHRNHLANLLHALALYLAAYGLSILIIIQLRFLPLDTDSLIRILIWIIFIVSTLIFIGFWIHFKNADLANYNGLFGRSVLSALKLAGIPILVLLVTWVVINRFDAREIKPGFAADEKPSPADINKDNGCYRLWTLSEAPEVDVDSEETLEKYRHLFGMNTVHEKTGQTWDQQAYRSNYRPYFFKRSGILKEKVHELDILIRPETDLVREIYDDQESILKLSRAYTVLLNRYRKLLGCRYFEDLTRPRFDSPLPNLLAWLHVSQLYDWLQVLDAREGNWAPALDNLMHHIEFQKMVLGQTRLLLVNLIGKANMRYTLYTLAGLMNQIDCPVSAYQTVLNRLPAGNLDALGTRKALQGDYLGWAEYIDTGSFLIGDNLIQKMVSTLFLQPERTKRYFLNPYQAIIQMESQPPYLWKTTLTGTIKKFQKVRRGQFWWIQNPFGKYLAASMTIPNLSSVIHKTVQLTSLADMVRISAELHIKYDPEKTVEENLRQLDSAKVPDPCSGKPYRWNGKKQVLYSLGVDRDDDGGRYRYANFMDTDYPLPIFIPNR